MNGEEHRARLLEAEDEAAAIETLHQLGCTDGLPVLAPTEQRVARLVLASGLDGDLDLGVMGPAYGATTVEKVCACAVMAGCLPDHMPVVIAAVRALLDPRLDLTELQATTFGTTPLVLVNGPARELCGVASGFGALGPGPRANASIGRALRLAMINLGGGRAGISDMALLGHGGKFTAVLGEDEEGSPWPPLHVARGCARIDSAVTLVGVEAPHSVIFLPPGDDESMEQAAERLLATLAAALAHPGSNNRILRGGAAVVALNPDHVRLLDLAGFERRSAAERICELTTFPRAEMERWIPALRGRGDDETARLAAFRDPDDLLWVVAGGSGLYSAVFPSWCAGPHGNRAVTVSFDPAPSCEIPG